MSVGKSTNLDIFAWETAYQSAHFDSQTETSTVRNIQMGIPTFASLSG